MIPLLFVTEYCERYAKKEAITNSTAELESSDEDISSSSDDDIAGHADP
jgi:ubiquitin-conjugating enzyme E2 H